MKKKKNCDLNDCIKKYYKLTIFQKKISSIKTYYWFVFKVFIAPL